MKTAFIDYTLGGSTSTFLLRELLELQKLEFPFEVLSHNSPAADRQNERLPELHCPVHWVRPVRLSRVLFAHARILFRSPARYLGCFAHLFSRDLQGTRDRLRTLIHLSISVTWSQTLEKRGIERIHSLWASGPGTSGYFLSRLLDLPYSFSCHATDIFVENLLLPQKIHRADRISTCTDYNRRYLESRFPHLLPHGKIRVCHHGIPLGRFSGLKKDPGQEARDLKTPVVLAVGQLDPKKGFADLVRAVSILSKKGFPVKANIIGEGQERSNLERLIEEEGLSHQVELLGALPFSKVLAGFKDADIFVMPSLRTEKNDMDGIPNVVLEAMAARVPVIATDVSGIPEVVQDNKTGVLLPSENPALLADAIEALSQDPERRQRLAAAGREQIDRRFDLKKTTTALHALLSSKKTHPIRIAIVSPNLGLLLSPEKTQFAGGAEVQQLLLGRELMKRQAFVVFIVRGDGGPIVEQRDGLILIKTAPQGTGVRWIRRFHPHLTSLWKAMGLARADIYSTRGAKVESGVVAGYCRLHGKGYIHSLAHDHDCAPDTPHELVSPLKRRIYGLAIKSADCILAQTQHQVDLLQRGFGVTATIFPNLVPEGEHADRKGQTVASQESGSEHKPLLWIGAIKPVKRPHLFLEMAKAFPRYRFQMIGFGKKEDPAADEYFQGIQEQARSMTNVEFLGFVPFARTNDYYRNASLLVSTAETEGFPNTHLQAFASETPVVAFCDPDNIIENQNLGRVVGSLGELKSTIEELMQKEEERTLIGKRGRTYVRRHHSPDLIVPEYLRLFSELTSHRESIQNFIATRAEGSCAESSGS